MASQSGDENSLLRLGSVIRDIERFDGDLTLYVTSGAPVEPEAVVVLVDEETAEPPAGMAYLLEIHLVRDVLRVWKDWRNGREPSVAEACAAVSFYANHDAYQPVD